jgi:hypothetical protein
MVTEECYSASPARYFKTVLIMRSAITACSGGAPLNFLLTMNAAHSPGNGF